jgi:hypothetical protein
MTEPQVGSSDRLSRPGRLRLGAVIAGSLAVVLGAAVAMGASPSPSASPAASVGAAADGSASPKGDGPSGPGWLRRGIGFEDFGGRFAFGGISIGAIEGDDLSLETEDGWSRTITVTDAAEITKGGEAIELADLAVGDRIRFAQSRNDDGTFTIERIAVVQPHVVGEVSAVSGNSITVETPDGSTVAVNVDGDTDYVVGGDEDATLSDVTVGMKIVAAGEQNDDGSLDATDVRAGEGLRGGRGHHWFGPDGEGDPTTEG